ncbi:hypothetical protein AN189_17680 [Loktanella sp. 3ANDIMAR09]|uniref:phage upper tail fiber protein n=1 Tax=Loktanella sp. 3ANDIMAR09 TaxID=1225657 RepID=UPI0007001FD6|nr:hypothetical protein [Loktanella sp. 3ANDIMAR09]KQI67053.1 hypothetical protein AN189_17680 [Loktanella sp. 3ANDIMAR09]
MARITSIAYDRNALANAALEMTHGAILKLKINPATPAPVPMSMGIAETEGGDPIVEIVSRVNEFILNPVNTAILKEGGNFRYDIWDDTDLDDRQRVATGTFKVQPSILTFPQPFDTQFLPDATSMVVLTQAEYDALTPPVDGVAYFIEAGA